jgi:hypothetical protein
MLNTTAVFFAVSLNFYFLSAFLKKPKNIYLFLLGLTVGIANNFHFQSIGFGSILIAFLLINSKDVKKIVKHILLIGTGYIVSFIPNIIFDLFNNFAWIKSVAMYCFGGGTNKFYYPVRWLTDIRDFWPQLWGSTVTGFGFIGYFLIIVYLLSIPKIFKQKITKKYNLILIISIIVQVFLLRYYKGVRSTEYLITFHSYFVVLTAFLINYISKNKYIFILILALYIPITLFANQKVINQTSQSQEILSIYKQINKGEINLYSLNGTNQVNLPIFYLYYQNNQIDTKNGYKIATCRPTEKFECPSSDHLIVSTKNYQIYDINDYSSYELQNYFQFTPEAIYNLLYINYPNSKKF